MNVLVDTPVWSPAFRKKNNTETNPIVDNLIGLVRNAEIKIIGAIRQEVLSGISDRDKYEEIKSKMSAFTDYVVRTADYEFAAECSNECRRHGIQGSHTDFLICAVAIKNGWEIFTEDNDYLKYEKYLPIKIYGLR